MKKITLLLHLFLFVWLLPALPQLTLVGNSTIPSFTPFVLDMQFQIPSKPGCNRVSTVLSFTTASANVLGEYVNLTGATFQLDPSQTLFPSVPVNFNNTTKSVSSQTVNGQSGVTTNIQFNLNTDVGVLCNNTQLQFRCKVFFFTAGSATPCDSVISSLVPVTFTAQNQWPVNLSILTNPSLQCRGNNIIYQVRSNHPANRTGVLNLYDPTVSFTLPVNATVVQVMNAAFSQSIPFTTVVGGATKTITFDADPFLPYNYKLSFNSVDDWIYNVIVKYECIHFSQGTTVNTSARLGGNDNCGAPVTITPSNANFTLNCSNCNAVDTPLLTKILFPTLGQFCPGGCAQNRYTIRFDNSNSATVYPALNLVDNIPPEVNITSITTQVLSAPVTLSFTTSANPNPQTLTVNTTSTMTAAQMGCAPPCRITSVTWTYTPFDAFSTVENHLFFTLNNTAQVGQQVTNTAAAKSSSPLLNVSVSLPYTVESCLARYGLSKRIVPPGSNNCVQQFSYSPGDEVTFRLRMDNRGSGTPNNVTVTDVLNSAFTFQPGSVRYYYGPDQCPPANDPLWQTTHQFPGSNPVTSSLNGQTLSFSNVNLPNCVSTRFLIEFRVKIKDLTLPGTRCNGFSIAGQNLFGNSVSDSACAVINSFIKLVTNMQVACKDSDRFTDSLQVKQGEAVTYRIEMKNEGNVNLSEPRIFNVRPRPGDVNSTCTATPRGSQFAVTYTGSTATNFVNELYGSTNCSGIICTGNPACASTSTYPLLQSLGAKGSTAVNLTPGASAYYFIDAVAGSGTIGQAAFNNALVNAKRADLGIVVPATATNTCRVTLSNTGCTSVACACGNWEYTRWDFINNSGQWVSGYFKCGDSLKYSLKPGNTHPFYYKYNCSDTSCQAQYSVTSDLPASAYTAGIDGLGQYRIKYTATDKDCGWHYFKVTPRCGDTDCPPCIVYFYVECKPVDCGEIIRDTVYCDPHNGPTYKFCVQNNSDFTTYLIKIRIPAAVTPVNIMAPAGATYTGSMGEYYLFSYPAGLAPGNALCTFGFSLAPPYTAGQQICLGVALHKEEKPPFINCCEDTTYKKCFIVPECRSACAAIIRDTVVCTQKGPVYSFCVQNNSDFTTYLIKIKIPAGVNPVNITAPAGGTYTGSMGGYLLFSYPAGLAPGATLCTFSFTLAQPYYAGQQICLGVALHKEQQAPFINCCEDSTYQRCFIVPDCPHPCMDIIRPSINCRYTPKGYEYSFSFSVQNNGLAELDSLELQYINPGTGITSDWCNYRLIPSIGPGGTSGILTCTFPFSPAPGSLHCFRVIGYDLHWLGGVWCVKDSCVSEMVCVIAPNCREEGGGHDGGIGIALVDPKRSQPQHTGFSVYPNPVNSVVTITAPAATAIQTIVIRSITGQAVAQYRVNSQPVYTTNLAQLKPGLYIITVNNRFQYKLLKE